MARTASGTSAAGTAGPSGGPGAEAGRVTSGWPALLGIRDLVVVRGNTTVLDIGQLSVEDGETLAVVGPNGAGKSTLLLAVAGLLEPGRGVILFRGLPIGRLGMLAYRRRLGLVLPDPLLFDASVFANVAAGLRFRGVSSREVRTRVNEWLEQLGVGHLANRPARHVSSGEAQRISLARALVLEPDLLLLDEPFASVDAASRTRLLDDFESLLARTRVASLFVTHDLDEAVRLGDRLAVIIGGRIRQVDAPRRVLDTPVDEDVAALVGIETRIEGVVASVRDGIAVVETAGASIEAASTLVSGRRVLACLRPEDITVWSALAGAASTKRVSSARNHIRGRVVRVIPEGPLVRVVLDCGARYVASLTRTSASEMGLTVGSDVYAGFKASAVHLIPLPE